MGWMKTCFALPKIEDFRQSFDVVVAVAAEVVVAAEVAVVADAAEFAVVVAPEVVEAVVGVAAE